MLPSWLRQLKKKRFVGHGATRPIRTTLHVETMEERITPDVAQWTGGTIQAANGALFLIDSAGLRSATTLWSDPGNWLNGRVPQPNDDVLFPAGLPQTARPTNLQFPVNSSIDRNFEIRNLTIEDEDFHIDFFAGDDFGNGGYPNVPAAEVLGPRQASNPNVITKGEIRSNIANAPAALTGLSLIGPNVIDTSPLRLTLVGQSQSLRADNIGVLKISASLIEPLDGSITDTDPTVGQVQQVGLAKTGTGMMVIGGANNFRGQVTVGQGILMVTNSQGLGDTLNGVEVTGPTATLALAQNSPGGIPTPGEELGTFRDSIVIRGAGANGNGSLIVSDDPLLAYTVNNFGDTGPSPVVDPNSMVRRSPVIIDGNVNLAASATIGTFSTFRQNLRINGQVTGGGDLTKVGTNGGGVDLDDGVPHGRLILTNKNAYTGRTFINAGAIEIQNNDALSTPLSPAAPNTADTVVAAGAALAINGSLTVPEVLTLNGGGGIDQNGNEFGALRMIARGGQANWTGAITFASNASVGVIVSNLTGLSRTFLTLSGQLTSAAAVEFSKVDQGALNVRPVDAAGVFIGNNNLRGPTFVRNGVLNIANPLALGPATAGAVTVTGNGNVQGTLQVQGNFTIGKTLSLSGQGTNSDGALRIFESPVGTPSVITWSGPIGLGTATSIRVDPDSSMIANGVISGGADTSNVDKLGLGSLTLNATNTYLGATTIREGTVFLTNSRGLGAPSLQAGLGTIVAAGASLVLPNPLNVTAENLTLSGLGVGGMGALQTPAGTTTFSGLVVLNGVNTTEADINVADAGTLVFSNVLSGDADLRKLGNGELRLTGTAPNQFVKTTFIDQGTIALAKNPGVQALGGPTGGAIVIGDGVGGNNVDVLRLDSTNQIPNVSSIVVRESGLFNLNNNDERLGGLTAVSLRGGEISTGTAVLTLGGAFTTAGSAEQSVINGNINIGGVTRAFGFSATPRSTLVTSQVTAPAARPVTFTFDADPNLNLSVPSGLVTFVDTFTGPDGVTTTSVLGTDDLDQNGTALLTVTSLVAGDHTITAQYSGDAAYPPLQVTLAQPQRIVNPQVQTLLSVNANPVGPNQPIAFAYRINGPVNTAVPTGGVRLFAAIGANPRFEITPGGRPVQVDPSGRAAFSLPLGLGNGVYTITAEYAGDATYSPSVTTLAPTLSVGAVPIVSVATGSVPLANQPTPPNTVPNNAQFGASPILRGDSARLFYASTGPVGVPTGTITFFDTFTDFQGTTTISNLGTRTLGQQGSPGGAFMDVVFDRAGEHVITAEYSGDAQYVPATGTTNPTVFVTNPVAPILQAQDNNGPIFEANPVVVNGQVTYTLRMNGRPGQPRPQGVVQFINTLASGARIRVGQATLNADPRDARYSVATTGGSGTTTVGVQNISADFTSSDDNYVSQQSIAVLAPQLNVVAAPTATQFVLSSNNNAALPNEPIRFSLRNPGNAYGTVSFRLNSPNGPSLDPVPLTPLATPTINEVPPGLPLLNFVSNVPATIVIGDRDPTNGSFGVGPNGEQDVGLPPGQYRIFAVYTAVPTAAMGNPLPSATFELQPLQNVIAPIGATLSASLNPIRTATPLTLTFTSVFAPTEGDFATPPNPPFEPADVAPVPTGNVDFFDGGVLLGTVALDATGQAVLSVPGGRPPGTRNIRATYNGNGYYRPVSAVIDPDTIRDPDLRLIVFGGNQVQTVVTSSANSARLGDNVTFTFSAPGNVNQVPATGTVQFRTVVGGVRTLIGPPQVLAGGVASVDTALLPVGVYPIFGDYSGDSNYAPSTTTLSPAQRIVNPPLTQLFTDTPLDPITGGAVQASNTPVRLTLSLRSNVLPAVNTPLATGSVQFFAAPIFNGTAGTPVLIAAAELTPVPPAPSVEAIASVVAAGFAPGTYRVTARYTATSTVTNPDRNFEPIEVVLSPVLTIVSAPTQVPVFSPAPSVLPIQQPLALFNGTISGTPQAGGAPPGIIKTGVGSLTLNGASDYTGPTVQNSMPGSAITLAGNNVLPNTPLVIASGTVDINGRTQTVAALADDTGTGGSSSAGVLAFTGGGTLTVDGAATTVYAGSITGTGTLNQRGPGSLTLGIPTGPGNPAFAGALNATGGTLLLNNNFAAANLTATAATVGGTGTVNDLVVNAGATVTVGAAPVGTAPGVAGTFTADNSATFNGGALAIDLFRVGTVGTVTGDRLVTAALFSGTARPILRLTASAYNNPTLGDNAVTIVTSTAAIPADFRFRRPDGSTLQENGTIANSGRAFRVNYLANSVTLTYAGLDVDGTLVPTANPSTPGDTITYTLTLPPGVGGSVTFTVSGPGAATPVSQTATVPADGVISASITFPSVGTYQVTAAYSGNATIAQKDFNLDQVVNIPTAMSLTTSNGSTTFGQPVTFTATVTSGGGVPTGTVTFTNLTTGEVLGTAQLSGGSASLTTGAVAAGVNTIRATYETDGTFRSNAADVVQRVTGPTPPGGTGPFYSNAALIPTPNGTQTLVVVGRGVPGGFALFPGFPRETVLVFTDINADGNGDIILILPEIAVVFDGATGGFLFVFGDLDNDGRKELLTFAPDGSFTIS